VDLIKDHIEFDGQRVSLPQHRLKHRLRSDGLEGAEVDADDNSVPKEYCAKIDGGLLIDLTRGIQRERGDYVDKTPFIMRKQARGL
jgi:hypothetical protein